jgi:hypothetical protein
LARADLGRRQTEELFRLTVLAIKAIERSQAARRTRLANRGASIHVSFGNAELALPQAGLLVADIPLHRP